MEDVMPRLADAVKEPAAARFLASKLQSGLAGEEKDKIFEAVLPEAAKLALGRETSLLVQRLMEHDSEDQRLALAEKFRGEVLALSTNEHGCHVIQKAAELLPEDARTSLVAELNGKVNECISSKHGNFVIQCVVRHMSPEEVGFILDEVTEKVETLAVHQFGCRVIQRLLERCTSSQVEPLVEGIMSRLDAVAKDRHGNYVVQCLMERASKEVKTKIIDAIRSDLVSFATNKAATHLVEKCFQVTTAGEDAEFLKDEREWLYRAVLDEADDGATSTLERLMQDKSGHFAVQSVIRHSREGEREELERRVLAKEEELNGTPTGKHILAAMRKAMGKETEEDAPAAEASKGAGVNHAGQAMVSKGSEIHGTGDCRPCAWFWKPQGCKNAENCEHCHACPEGALKARKKQKKGKGGPDEIVD
mmetsp:Transcript_67399/g.197922  ORF Transcript_67399/g.197922 Transcript_67399/m.197922 type:complete len:420 (+) Transcript_67399:178-1437(+)